MSLHKLIKSSSWRYLFLLIIPVFVLQLSSQVYGLSAAQQALFNSGVYYFDISTNDCGGTTVLVGTDNMQKAFNYFVQKGLTDFQAAGIVGNLIQESHVSPVSVEAPPGKGHGIAQWGLPGRWDTLLTYATSNSVDPLALATQLDFIWSELNGAYISTLASVIATTSIDTATTVFENGYEAAGKPQMANRISYAQQILQKYGGSATTSVVSSGQIGCASAANCSVNAQLTASGLSQVRQNVVCIAEQELAVWKPLVDNPANLLGTEYLKYTQKAPDEWCADFVSWVYDQANYPLQSDPNWRLSTVYEIKQLGDKNQNFHYHDSNNYTPRPGDLAILSTRLKPYYHVNIVVAVVGSVVTLTGGNQANLTVSGGPNSSFVTQYQSSSFTGEDISGYVSPD